MPRRPLISDREIVRLAEDLVRRGSWRGRRIRAAGFEPCPGRPRCARPGAPDEVSLLTALAERTGYATRTLRRALSETPRAGKEARRGPEPESRPVVDGSESVMRGLAAVGLRAPAPAAPPLAVAPTALVREALIEALEAALATEGALAGSTERLAAEGLLAALAGR